MVAKNGRWCVARRLGEMKLRRMECCCMGHKRMGAGGGAAGGRMVVLAVVLPAVGR